MDLLAALHYPYCSELGRFKWRQVGLSRLEVTELCGFSSAQESANYRRLGADGDGRKAGGAYDDSKRRCRGLIALKSAVQKSQ